MLIDDQKIEQIVQLGNVCGKNLEAALNVPMLRNRQEHENNDFLHVEDGMLVGYLGMFSIVQPEKVEITAMVHPDYRRRGIFSALWQQAKEECERRRVEDILLVAEESSVEAKIVAKAIGAVHAFSEYRLDFQPPANREKMRGNHPTLRLLPATEEHTQDLVAIGMSSFGDPNEEVMALIERNQKGEEHQLYIAMDAYTPVGMITVTMEEDTAFLTGFGVMADQQGKGYGRAILQQITEKLVENSIPKISLEVETDNENALHLYTSSGFKVVSGYDYFRYEEEGC